MRDPAFGWTVEMQIKVARTGSRIREVPVSYRRRVGVSKITGTALGTLRAGAKILATIFYYAWIEPRLRRSSSRALRRAIRLAA